MANVTTITLVAQEAVVEKLSMTASNIAGISAGVILAASSAVAQTGTELELEAVTPDLHLSDFNVDLRVTDAAALITVGTITQNDLYRVSSSQGVLTEGKLGVGNSNVAINRIRRLSNNRIRIQESSGTFSLEDHLGTDNTTSEWTLYIQVQNTDGSFSTVSSNQLGATTGNRVDFEFSSTDGTVLNSIEDGDRFIIAIGKPSDPISVEATLSGTGGLLSSTITKIAAPAPTQLELDDFDTTGLTVDALALLTASGDNDWYTHAERGGTDTPTDAGTHGLGLGDNDTIITRIRQQSNNSTTVILNDSDVDDDGNTASLTMSSHFGSGTSEWTLYIQTRNADGTFNVISTDQVTATGGSYVNFRFDNDDLAVLNSITTGERFIIAVAKAVEEQLESIEAVISGTGGSLSSNITKTSPGTESVNATLIGVESAVSSNITKTSPGTESVNAVLSGVGGSLSSTITVEPAPVVTPQLQLSDFDQSGLDTPDVLAVITAEFATENVGQVSGTSWYRDTRRGGTDTPDAGELGLGANETVITRIWRSGDRVLLNDNDVQADGTPAALSLLTHFGSGTSDWTLYIQTRNDDGTFNVASSDVLISAGGGFVNFRFASADLAVLDSVSDGSQFIIAIAQAAEEQLESIEAVLSGTGGILVSSINKSSPGTESVEAVLAGVGGTLSTDIGKSAPGTKSISAILTGTGGSLSSTITVEPAPVTTPTLELDDFDTTGLDDDVLALITAGAEGDLRYRASPAVGTRDDGELGLGDSETPITRIRIATHQATGNKEVRLHDDNDSFNLGTHFTGADSPDWTLHIQTRNDDGTFNVISSDDIRNAGGNFVNYRFSDSADQTILDSIVSGTKFIIAVTQPAEEQVESIEVVISGTGGVLTSNITKSSPGTEAVNITLTGAPGSLPSVAITKTSPGTESVSVILTGAGGLLSADIGKTSPGTESVNAVLSGIGGSISSAITKVAPAVQLQLSDFDDTGLEVDAKALIVASGSAEWYRDANRNNGTDTVESGELGLSTGETLITWIRRSGNRITINDNDVPEALTLSTYFGDGDTSQWRLYIQTSDGVTFSNTLDGVGNSYAHFDDFDDNSIITGITTGTRFIIAVARPEPAPVEAVISGTGGSLVTQITKSSPGTESINAVLTGAGGALSASITKTSALELSDFDTEGLEVDVLALITSGGTPWFQSADYGESDTYGTLEDGELALNEEDSEEDSGTRISQIDYAGSGLLFLYDNNIPEELHLAEYLGTSAGAYTTSLWTLYIQTASGVASTDLALSSTDSQVLFLFSDNLDILNGIGDGDQFIIAFAKSVQSIEAVISGTPGSLPSAIITKTEPGTEFVEAVLTDTGGVLSAAIAKTSPGTESVNAVIVGTSGSISADITKVEPEVLLELSDFNDDGLTVDAAALITIEDSGNIWYRNDFPNDTDHGDLVAGELGLNGDAETPITSIRLRGSGSRILINNDGHTADLSLRTHFGNNNATSQWTLYVQTDQHVISSNQLANTANRFVNFTFDNTGRDILNALQDGDRVIIAIAQAAEQLESIEAVLQGSPNASIVSQITKSAPGTESVDAILTGTGGSLSSTVTKTSPGTESVTAVIAGSAGSVSTRITKTSPGTKSVNTTLAGTGGSISADIGKSSPGTESIEAVITGTGGTLSTSITKVGPDLQLSDFDDTGLTVDAAALLVASGNDIWYADSDRQGTDAPVDGELRLNDSGLDADGNIIGGTQISRIWNNNSNNTNILVNNNNNPVNLALEDHFGADNAISDWILYIQTASGVAKSNQLANTGGGFANFTFSGQTNLDILGSIATGTRFIVAVAKPTEAVSIEATINGIGGDVDIRITKSSPGTESVAATISGTGSVFVSSITKTSPGTESINAILVGTDGSLVADVSKSAPGTESIAAVIAGDGGSLSSIIAKSSPGTESIDAVLTSVGGSLSANITKDTPANKSVEATLVGTAGSLASADIGTLSIFELSDFNQTGLEIDVLALITASGSATWYADTSRSGSDTVDDGELGLGGTETLISRIRQTNSTTILINDNDIPTAIVLEDHLGITEDNTDTSAWTLYIQTRDGVVSSNSLSSTGGGYANFRFDSADSTILNSIITGTEFIIALARKLHSVEVVFRGVPHSTIAAIGKIGVESKDIEAVWPVRQVPEAIASVTLGAQEIGSERLPLTTTNISGISAGVIAISHGAIAQQAAGLQASIADPIESTASFTAQVTVAEPEDKSVEAVIVGTGGSLVSAITKTAPGTESIAATIVGTSGSVVPRITKTAPGTESIEAVLSGTGGVLASANITKTELPPKPVEAIIQGTAGLGIVSADIGKVTALVLSDFDQTGLEIDALALIAVEVAGDTLFQNHSDFGTSHGDVLTGDIGLGDADTLIARILKVNDTRLRINDKDVDIEDDPAPLALNTYFGSSNQTSQWRLYIQTREGVVSSNDLANTGGGYANFDFNAGELDILDNLEVGDRFIVAVARRVHAVEAVLQGTGGTLPAANITKTSPGTKSVEFTAVGVGSILSPSVTIASAGTKPITAVLSSTGGIITSRISKIGAGTENVEAVINGTGGALSVDIAKATPGTKDIAATWPLQPAAIIPEVAEDITALTIAARKFIVEREPLSTSNIDGISVGITAIGYSSVAYQTAGLQFSIAPQIEVPFIAEVTKVSTANKPVEAIVQGTSGTIVANITKVGAGSKAVNAIIVGGSDASVVSNITKTTISNKSVEAVLTGVGGALASAELGKIQSLLLSDFDKTGLEIDVLGLITADISADGTWYSDSNFGPLRGTLEDGEIGMGDDETLIARVRRINDTTILINDRDDPEDLDLNDANYFGSGTTSKRRLYIQTRSGVVFSNQLAGIGESFARFTFTDDDIAVLDSLQTGNRFIIAIATKLHSIEAVISGTGGGLDARITKDTPATKAVNAVLTGVGGALSTANITKEEPGEENIEIIWPQIVGIADTTALSIAAQSTAIEQEAVADSNIEGLKAGVIATTIEDIVHDSSGLRAGVEIPVESAGKFIAQITKDTPENVVIEAVIVGGSDAAIVGDITKVSPGTESVAATLIGTGGALAATVTKADAGLEGVEVVFTGVGGSIVSQITKDTPENKSVKSTIVGVAGEFISPSIGKTEPGTEDIAAIWPRIIGVADTTPLTLAVQEIVAEELPLEPSDIEGLSAGVIVTTIDDIAYNSTGLRAGVEIPIESAASFIAEIRKPALAPKSVKAVIVGGSESSIISNITKDAPANKPITAVIVGVGGTLSKADITKSALIPKPVEATIIGVGGTIIPRITIAEPGTENIEVVWPLFRISDSTALSLAAQSIITEELPLEPFEDIEGLSAGVAITVIENESARSSNLRISIDAEQRAGEFIASITKVEVALANIEFTAIGTGGTLIADISVSRPGTESIEFESVGIGGTFISQVTKAVPGIEDIEATWPQPIIVEDTTALTLVAQEVITEELELTDSNIEGLQAGVAVITSGTAHVSSGLQIGTYVEPAVGEFIAEITKRRALVLADFNPDNVPVEDLDPDNLPYEIDALALITADFSTQTVNQISGDSWYRDTNRSGDNTPTDGELGLGTNETVITRIWRAGNRVLINDNDVNATGLSAPVTLSSHFGATNQTAQWTLFIQTLDGIVSSNQLLNTGGGFANFEFDNDDLNILDSVADGDRFIIAVARRVHAVEAVFTGVGGTLPSAQITKASPGTESIEFVAASIGGIFVTEIAKTAPGVEDIEATWPPTYKVLDAAALTIAAQKIVTEELDLGQPDTSIDISAGVSVTVISDIAHNSSGLQFIEQFESASEFIARIDVVPVATKSVEFIAAGTGGAFIPPIVGKIPAPVEDVGIVFSGIGGEFIATVDKVEADIESIEATWPLHSAIEDVASLTLAAHEITTEELPLDNSNISDISAGVTVEISETGTPYSSGLRIGATQPIESASKFIASIEKTEVGEEAVTFIATGGTGAFIVEITKDTPVNKPIEATFIGTGGSIEVDVATVGVDLFPEALFPNVTFPGSLFPGGHEISGDLLFPDRLFTGTQFPPGLFVEGVEAPEERNIEAVWPPRGVTTSEDAASLAIAARSTIIEELPLAASNITGLKAGITVTVDNNDIASNSTGLQISTLDLVDNASSFIAEVESVVPSVSIEVAPIVGVGGSISATITKQKVLPTPMPPFLVGADDESIQWDWIPPEDIAARGAVAEAVRYNFRHRAVGAAQWITSWDTSLHSKRVFSISVPTPCGDIDIASLRAEFRVKFGLELPDIIGALTSIGDMIKKAIEDAIRDVLNTIKAIKDAIQAAIDAIFDAVWAIIESIINTVEDIKDAVIDAIKAAIRKAIEDAIAAAIAAALNALDTVNDAVNAASDAVEDTIDDIINAVNDAINSVLNSNIISTIRDAIDAALNSSSGIVDAIRSAINNALDTLDSIHDTVRSAIDAARSTIDAALTALEAARDAIETAIRSAIDTLLSQINAIVAIFDAIRDAIRAAIDAARAIIQAALAIIKDWLAFDFDPCEILERIPLDYTGMTAYEAQVQAFTADGAGKVTAISNWSVSSLPIKLLKAGEDNDGDLTIQIPIDGSDDGSGSAVDVAIDALTGVHKLLDATGDEIQGRIALTSDAIDHVVFDKNGKAVFIKDGFVVKPESPPIDKIPVIKQLAEVFTPEGNFRAVSRKGDNSTGHGCYPSRPSIAGSPNVFVNHIPVHRKGDAWAIHGCAPPCTPHGGVLQDGSPTVEANERRSGPKEVARVGDPITCGDYVAEGSPNIFCDGDD